MVETSPLLETAAAPRAAAVPVLGPGDAQVVAHADGTVSIVSNNAPRLRVLRALGAELDFIVEAHIPSWGFLTTETKEVSLREALPIVIGDAEYKADWFFNADTDEHTLISVTVGTPRSPEPESTSATYDPAQAEERMVVETLPSLLDERPSANLSYEELQMRLRDPDPEVRMAAVIEIEADGEDFDTVVDLLANDPDPGVRAAATVSLENSDQIGGVNALLEALNDPNPAVVVEVIESLEFAGDESIVPQLVPFLQHSDPRVQEAAVGAIEFLDEPADDS